MKSQSLTLSPQHWTLDSGEALSAEAGINSDVRASRPPGTTYLPTYHSRAVPTALFHPQQASSLSYTGLYSFCPPHPLHSTPLTCLLMF